MAGLAAIRTVESGSTKSLRAFERALATIRREMVKAAQLEGRKVWRAMGARYARGMFANRAGQIVPIKPYGPKWKRRKEKLKLDKRRGVARKGVLKTMNSPKMFVKTRDGFVIDPERPDITVTGRATVGKSERNLAGKRIFGVVDGKRSVIGMAIKTQVTNRRSFRVNNYLGAFADQKAPGLGNISSRAEKDIVDAVTEAARKHLRSVRGAARVLSRQAAAKLELKIGKLVT